MNTLIPTKTIKENGVIAVKNGIKPNPNKHIPIERKPTWLRVKSQNSAKFRELKQIVSQKNFIQFVKRLCAQIFKSAGVTVLQPLCCWDLFAPGRANFVL